MLTSCGVFRQSTNVARRNWAKNFLNSITFIHCNWYEIWNVPSTAFWENCKVTHQMVHCEQFSCIVYDPLHDVQFNDLKTFNSLAITHSSADVLQASKLRRAVVRLSDRLFELLSCNWLGISAKDYEMFTVFVHHLQHNQLAVSPWDLWIKISSVWSSIILLLSK